MTSGEIPLNDLLSEDSLDIAIIGMAGRFPGAASVEEFWQNLKDGVESISFFTGEAILAAGEDPRLLAMPGYVRAKPALQNVDCFDASFFGFTPREAELLDPQHRVFIECAWHALERAGYAPQTYPGSIGVFAGATISTYLLFNLLESQRAGDLVDRWQIGIGNEKDSVPTRVSHLFDLRGPSINVQSACSTSLVAVHLACQSLLNYQCDMALAGGVSIHLPQNVGYLGQAGLWSTDGHCRPFDAKASGMITGDGVGVVVLKRLADAIADRDAIAAIIKGSAVNNDGALKVGYTAPGLRGQTEVIMAAQAIADVHPESIGYIETHGTGTPLGDSIEFAALVQAFERGTSKKQFCAIGSVKSNIGHADNAAGVAGLIKAVLSLKHQQIPASLHFETANPEIDLANSPFRVNTGLTPWRSDGSPRRAGVSAFGIGGTNAHIILEEAPPHAPSGQGAPWKLLSFSAKTEQALEAATDLLARHLEQHPDANLSDIAYTYHCGRSTFDCRRTLVCHDRDDALAALARRDPARLLSDRLSASTGARALLFMFPGIGHHYVDMGLGLYQTQAVFREHVDECARILLPYLKLDVRDLLFAGQRSQAAVSGTSTIDLRAMLRRAPDAADGRQDALSPTRLAHPAIFAIEYALARLLMHWGMHPQAVIGHSLGEYVAACLAEVFRLDDALMIVAKRAELIDQLSPGGMLAVPLSVEEVAPYLSDGLTVAIVNGPSYCVVAGDSEAIAALERRLALKAIACRRLAVEHAFHSPAMEPLVEQFRRLMAGIALQPPKIPFVSNVTGTWITDEQATSADYWARHMCETVQFGKGLQVVLRDRDDILIEVGPGQSLTSFAKLHPDYKLADQRMALATMPHVHEQQPDLAFLLKTLGQLWMAGVPIDWGRFYEREQRRRVPLPGYPFERQRYWVEPVRRDIARTPPQRSLDKRPDMGDWFYLPMWRQTAPVQFLKPRGLLDGDGCWLVFADDSRLSRGVVELLSQSNEVVTVLEGQGFIRINQHEYVLHPAQAEDYDALCDTLRAQGKTPKGIVHLWSYEPVEAGSCEQLLDTSFYSLLFLAQALGKHFASDTLHIKAVSNNLYQVIGEERIAPEKATLLGACKVIPQEFANLRCQVIDLVLPGSDDEIERALGQLLAEITGAVTDMTVAYRGAQRWVQAFEPIYLEPQVSPPARLRPGGVYLLIGGLGGIGLSLARYLAETAPGAKLALLGRSALPPRATWDTWLTEHGERDSTSRKIAGIRDLERFAAEVLALHADVADEPQMRAAVRQVYQRFGRVDGIIHSAGVEAGGLIALKTGAMAADVLAAKVRGLRVVEALFKDADLDFLVLCSSVNALRGQIGQVDHCASFAFMDAFAHYYTKTSGTPTVSVNWPAWRDVGLAVNIDIAAVEPFREDILRSAITPQEGAEAFGRVLNTGVNQIVVSPQDLVAVLEEASSRSLQDLQGLMDEPGVVTKEKYPRPALKNAYVAPRDTFEHRIAEIWQNLLGIDQVGIYDHFIELGGHSLLAVQVLSRINDAFAINIPINVLFEAPTIADLATRIKDLPRNLQPVIHDADDRDEGVL